MKIVKFVNGFFWGFRGHLCMRGFYHIMLAKWKTIVGAINPSQIALTEVRAMAEQGSVAADKSLHCVHAISAAFCTLIVHYGQVVVGKPVVAQSLSWHFGKVRLRSCNTLYLLRFSTKMNSSSI